MKKCDKAKCVISNNMYIAVGVVCSLSSRLQKLWNMSLSNKVASDTNPLLLAKEAITYGFIMKILIANALNNEARNNE